MEETEKPTGAEVTAGLKLCQLGQEVSVSAGARIVSQGETPEFFYVIQSGRVRVFRETADRIRTPLTELGAGAYFGEVALVTGQPRTASVEAMEESILIKVSKEEFDRLLDDNPQTGPPYHQSIGQLAGDRGPAPGNRGGAPGEAAPDLLVRLCPHDRFESHLSPDLQHLQRQSDSPHLRLGRKERHSRDFPEPGPGRCTRRTRPFSSMPGKAPFLSRNISRAP